MEGSVRMLQYCLVGGGFCQNVTVLFGWWRVLRMLQYCLVDGGFCRNVTVLLG